MASYKISALSDPSAPTVLGTEALALNNSGTVVGQAGITGTRAVYWNPSPTVTPLGDVMSVAYGVNDSGDVVGTRQAGGVQVFPGDTSYTAPHARRVT